MAIAWGNNRAINFKFDFKITLKQSEAYIKREIIKQLRDLLAPKLVKATRGIEIELKALFEQKIRGSETYKSLKGEGERSLLGHFGFDDGGNKVDEIVKRWIDSIKVDMVVHTSGHKLGMGFQVYMINKSFVDVLGMEAAYQDVTDAEGKHGINPGLLRAPTDYAKIPWLRWLLLFGDQIILREHWIHFEPGLGRSNQAILVKAKKTVKRWGVPREYGDAGTADNNWVVNIIKEMQPLMNGIIDRAVHKYLPH